MYALKKLPKSTFGILLSMEPAVGALSGFFVLQEVLNWTQWIAIACVTSACIGARFGTKDESEGATAENIPADAL